MELSLVDWVVYDSIRGSSSSSFASRPGFCVTGGCRREFRVVLAGDAVRCRVPQHSGGRRVEAGDVEVTHRHGVLVSAESTQASAVKFLSALREQIVSHQTAAVEQRTIEQLLLVTQTCIYRVNECISTCQ